MLNNDTLSNFHPKEIIFKDKNFQLVLMCDPIWHNFLEKSGAFLSKVAFEAFCFGNLILQDNRTDTLHFFFCLDQEIQEINHQHRNIDKPTNVLSFPVYTREELEAQEYLFADEQIFGDIFISHDYCMNEGKQKNISFQNHIAHMIVHGILHIFGFDHITDQDAEIMEMHEIEILAKFDIASPYNHNNLP